MCLICISLALENALFLFVVMVLGLRIVVGDKTWGIAIVWTCCLCFYLFMPWFWSLIPVMHSRCSLFLGASCRHGRGRGWAVDRSRDGWLRLFMTAHMVCFLLGIELVNMWTPANKKKDKVPFKRPSNNWWGPLSGPLRWTVFQQRGLRCLYVCQWLAIVLEGGFSATPWHWFFMLYHGH